VRALIDIPVALAVAGLTWLQDPLKRLLALTDEKPLGPCPACGAPVFESDPFLRYRGEYYHGDLCTDLDPPALRLAQILSD
jgi:hypothetical protein